MAQFATAERARPTPATPIDRARRQREDQRLMRKVQTGDDRAREELIERYMPLARSLALRYRRPSSPHSASRASSSARQSSCRSRAGRTSHVESRK